ncbi:MAG: uroporphyrinogen-III synthase [Mariprofundaceae bacterium]|nr:uroporphyrinogen-III synthase [Mariprofundaceae bacterium]
MGVLQAKNILLTRTVAQNQQTAALLATYGANPVYFPCLAIETLSSELKAGLQALATAEKCGTDVIFSSQNGVDALFSCVAKLSEVLQGYRIIAVGHKTAERLRKLGCNVDVIPQHASQQGLVANYEAVYPSNQPKRVFFFRAEQGSDVLADYFARKHIPLQLIPSYRALCVQENPADVVQKLQTQSIDAVLLGSAQVATCYAQKTAPLKLKYKPLLVVMSGQVAAAADKAGLKVQLVAKQPSFAAMLDVLSDYYSLS